MDWATDSEVQEIINVLKFIDPGYDISICSWGNSSPICLYFMSSFKVMFAIMIT